MSMELQSKQDSLTPAAKKAWKAPEIQVLNLRDAQIKTGGIADGFGRKSH